MSRRAAIALASLLAVVAAGLGAATVNRNRIYSTEVAFWADATRKSPQKSRPHNNLGVALLDAGETDRALDEFRTALALDPANVTARNNLRRAWELRRARVGPDR